VFGATGWFKEVKESWAVLLLLSLIGEQLSG
jgi:hypothetical protein